MKVKASVYFADAREHHHHNLYDKIRSLFHSIKLSDIIKKNDTVAVKIHFGEYGNSAYIRPSCVRIVVDEIIQLGGRPFLTDGSTLYKGSRSDAVNHLNTAIKNGFAYAVINAPLIIADGLKGGSCVKIKVNGKHCEFVDIGAEAYHADALVVLTHFKLHELTAIGGSIKNIAMGLAGKSGKLAMHSSVAPSIKGSLCKKCMLCRQVCPVNAMITKEKCLQIDPEKCIGCGQCIMICPENAVNVVWNAASNITQEKYANTLKAYCQIKKINHVLLIF